jgi:hypothetical protein
MARSKEARRGFSGGPQREWSNMDLGGTNVAAASVLHGPRRAVYAG